MRKNTVFTDLQEILKGDRAIFEKVMESVDERGRFSAVKVAENAKPILATFGEEPEEGWLSNAYNHVLGQLFPEKQKKEKDSANIQKGRNFLLKLLSLLYKYEKKTLAFDPTMEMCFLDSEEIAEGGYNREYLRLIRLIEKNHVYEFMRIGTEITPYNTLGHIAGVHYVAMHAARQLNQLKIPVDLGLISGAAAGHDIGKYGCKKSEEKRIPYLHYYYTDMCFNRFEMPMIGYIAANHSTWDLELENLSVESLLLIYADFRVKSKRNEEGREEVKFYTLEESFHVILGKLDNVDKAKEHRYHKVYNKLKDFEKYMIKVGVDVDLPQVPQRLPETGAPKTTADVSLMSGKQVVEEFKHLAVEHNIRLMNKFYREEDFADLLETVRSEKQWKNLRTYISILGEYSTYMTEKQKLMTLRFLRELLVHRESDIRNQAAEIVGKIVAAFNDDYKKELPEGVALPKKEVTNLSLWEDTLNAILVPDYKLTDQHKKWITNSLKSVVAALIDNCAEEIRKEFLDSLLKWYMKDDLGYREKSSLLQTAMNIHITQCSDEQRKVFLDFAKRIMNEDDQGLRVAAVGVRYHFRRRTTPGNYRRGLKACLGFNPNLHLPKEALSEMYLDNLKASTPWAIKVANIQLMLQSLEEEKEGRALHVATHLGNLIKVSETVVVRKRAGESLLSMINKMPLEQRNEIAVELGKGLEIGDYQFSKYIPEYLGVIMLHLPPRELDELIADLEKLLEATNGQVAAAVLNTFGVVLENYNIYSGLFGKQESREAFKERKNNLVGLLVRGFANYNETISGEALWIIGMRIFGSPKISMEEKYNIFCRCGKKLLSLYETRHESNLEFYNNAAVLNQIYRFISLYELEKGSFDMAESQKIAFFPGTFDPFSLSHKAIATEIRDMGYEVYLALDEFSWSKKTQPRLQRRRILSMSVADEENIYVFPDHIPVNIANPRDLKRLKEIFKGKDLYFVAGSDVIENASCYRAEPRENSIHSMNHLVFKRFSDERQDGASGEKKYPITGQVINLHLEEHYEDISSTRIRENIDLGRDISNLIDPVAQNYIYANNLYLREPAYKHILQARDMRLEPFKDGEEIVFEDMTDELTRQGYDMKNIISQMNRQKVKIVAIRDGSMNNKVVAIATVTRLDSIDLLTTFKDQDIAAYIRSKAAGAIAVIGGIYYHEKSSISNLDQIILMEMLSELLARDYTYVVYHPWDETGLKGRTVRTVEKQGFINIAAQGSRPIYAVDMRSPVVIFKNVDTIIKNPLNKNPQVLNAVEAAHNRLLEILTGIYPGEVIMSYNSGMMHYKMIDLITRLNGVSPVPYKDKKYGRCMVVPFGKVLEGVAVPNSVTKALHTEKYFTPDLSGFSIEERSFYSTLEDQIRTIKSFARPVILVDDLLHKGYRMKEIDPILKENHVEVVDTVVGVQTGRGRDLMTIKGRTVDSAYFLPNLKCWIDESAMYPYIGGDSMKDKETWVSGEDEIPALNLLMPYAVPSFLGEIPPKSIYDYSMACLENARDILRTIEEEYQKEFEQKLTIKRLGEVIVVPRNPEVGEHITLDENAAPSIYVERDIERLVRMRKMFI